MIRIDRECSEIVSLFTRRGVKALLPESIRNSDAMFRRRGDSFNLKNIREYQGSDDPRRIDWKLYGRSDRICVKEFFEEESERIYLLLDSSASMSVFPREVFLSFSASLAYMLLKLGFSLRLVAFASRLRAASAPIRGEKNLSSALSFLEKIDFGGEGDILSCLADFSSRFDSGRLILLSDFLDPGYKAPRIFKKLYQVHFWASFFSLNPELGMMEVRDPETGRSKALPWSSLAEREYLRREEKFLESLSDKRPGLRYYRVEANSSRPAIYWEILEDLHD